MATRTYDATMQFNARRRQELMDGAEPLECERVQCLAKEVQSDDLLRYAKGQQMIVTQVEPQKKKIKGRKVVLITGEHYLYGTEVVLSRFATETVNVLRACELTEAQ